MDKLKIGKLSLITGVSTETLRFYESKGLLAVPVRSAGGYRLYSQEDVDRVGFIVRARQMGFALKEIEELLSLSVDKTSSTCGEVKELAEQKLALINQKIAELSKMREALEQITDACCGGSAPATVCTILNALEEAS